MKLDVSEAEWTFETPCFIKTLHDGHSKKKEEYVTESYTLVTAL
jgi:hypothetical protein